MIRTLVLAAAIASFGCGAAHAGPAEHCATIGNDDRVRPYDPALRRGFLRAFAARFPHASGAPDDRMLRTEGSYRCMAGRLYACFTGANLPCGKIVTRRSNPGAAAYCRSQPNAASVPLAATGHDVLYAYRCRGGRPVVTGTGWTLDARGFAKEVWAPMN